MPITALAHPWACSLLCLGTNRGGYTYEQRGASKVECRQAEGAWCPVGISPLHLCPVLGVRAADLTLALHRQFLRLPLKDAFPELLPAPRQWTLATRLSAYIGISCQGVLCWLLSGLAGTCPPLRRTILNWRGNLLCPVRRCTMRRLYIRLKSHVLNQLLRSSRF